MTLYTYVRSKIQAHAANNRVEKCWILAISPSLDEQYRLFVDIKRFIDFSYAFHVAWKSVSALIVKILTKNNRIV